MRIAVDMLLDPEATAVLLHHHAEVHVQGGGVCGKAVVESVLHVASGIFGI